MDEALRARIEHRKSILAAIKQELVERLQLEFDPAILDDDTFLFGSGLALDSIDAMELIIGLQARFGVELPEGDLAPMRTINTLADVVCADVRSAAA
jgi:acyl carrier protein